MSAPYAQITQNPSGFYDALDNNVTASFSFQWEELR